MTKRLLGVDPPALAMRARAEEGEQGLCRHKEGERAQAEKLRPICW